uniref:Anoctamin n=1 Tax=Macrostomum lignano TaxID=282301 RepID=A0A1I8FC40_9PLAT
LINVAGMSIGMGIEHSLRHATYGSRNRNAPWVCTLQRSFLLMNLALLPLACLHLNIRPLLLLIGQFQFNYLVLSRYLQNQSRMAPPMIAAFVANVFNASAQYVAIHVLDFSYLATAVVQAASMGMMFFITLAYILWTRMYRETWDGWKLESLYDWGDFIKAVCAGYFPHCTGGVELRGVHHRCWHARAVQLAAQSIVFQLESISYMIPFGMSVAVNIRVGQQLGAQPARGSRPLLPGWPRHDRDIVSTAAQIIPLLGLFQLFDGISVSPRSSVASLPDPQLLGQPPRSSVARPASLSVSCSVASCWASLPILRC